MSVHVVSWAWQQKVDDPTAKLVLVKLADSANDDGICWPSQRTLAAHCEINERSIRYKLDKLVSLDLLQIRQRTNEDGTRNSNVYLLASGNALPLADPAAKSRGNVLPLNRKLEPSELFSGNGLPVECRHCGPLAKVRNEKQLREHYENVHGIYEHRAS